MRQPMLLRHRYRRAGDRNAELIARVAKGVAEVVERVAANGDTPALAE